MLDCGVAEGPKDSWVRTEQVRSLWSSNFTDLHVNIPRSDKIGWMAWANKVGEGGSFFARALEHSPEDQFKSVLAEWIPPPHPDVSVLPLSQAERRDIVNSAISTWFSLMTMDEARKMSSLPNAVYRKSLNGHRIHIGRAETAYLDFQTPMGEQHCIKMSIPQSAVPKDEDDSRITWLSVI